MSLMFNLIKMKYDKGYVRLDQLQKYVELGVITQEEFNIIIASE